MARTKQHARTSTGGKHRLATRAFRRRSAPAYGGVKRPGGGFRYELDGREFCDGRASSEEEEYSLVRGADDLEQGANKHAAASRGLVQSTTELLEAEAALLASPQEADLLERVSHLKRTVRHYIRRAASFADYACAGCYAVKFSDELTTRRAGKTSDKGVCCDKCSESYCTPCFSAPVRLPFPGGEGVDAARCVECWDYLRDKANLRARADVEFEIGAAAPADARTTRDELEAALATIYATEDEQRIFACKDCYLAECDAGDEDDKWTCFACSAVFCSSACGCSGTCITCSTRGLCGYCCDNPECCR